MNAQQQTDQGGQAFVGVLLIFGALYGYTLTGTHEENFGYVLIAIACLGWRFVAFGLAGLVRLWAFFSICAMLYTFNERGNLNVVQDFWPWFFAPFVLLFMKTVFKKSPYAVSPLTRLYRWFRS